MKRKVLLLCIAIMLGLMLFTNIDHIIWIKENALANNSSWSQQLFPLIINNIVWIAIIPLFLLWLSKREISNLLIGLLVTTSIAQIGTTIYARIATDPLAAGMPFVVVAIPLSVILLIFSIKELRNQ